MGTRADFYVGRGPSAEWLGSIAWDGHPETVMEELGTKLFETEELFRHTVGVFLARRDDSTPPEMGWPWPWDDSQTTDYAYAYEGGAVWCSSFGHEWFDPVQPEPDDEGEKAAIFPDMSARQKVTFGKRSGVILITLPGKEGAS